MRLFSCRTCQLVSAERLCGSYRSSKCCSSARRILKSADPPATADPDNPRSERTTYWLPSEGDTDATRFQRFEQATYFELSVEDKGHMRPLPIVTTSADHQWRSPRTVRHQATPGRPLWSAYHNGEMLLSVAKDKIQGHKHKYDSRGVPESAASRSVPANR